MLFWCSRQVSTLRLAKFRSKQAVITPETKGAAANSRQRMLPRRNTKIMVEPGLKDRRESRRNWKTPVSIIIIPLMRYYVY